MHVTSLSVVGAAEGEKFTFASDKTTGAFAGSEMETKFEPDSYVAERAKPPVTVCPAGMVSHAEKPRTPTGPAGPALAGRK